MTAKVIFIEIQLGVSLTEVSQIRGPDGSTSTMYHVPDEVLKRFDALIVLKVHHSLEVLVDDLLLGQHGDKRHFATSSEFVARIPDTLPPRSNHQILLKIDKQFVLGRTAPKVGLGHIGEFTHYRSMKEIVIRQGSVTVAILLIFIALLLAILHASNVLDRRALSVMALCFGFSWVAIYYSTVLFDLCTSG